MIDQLIIGDKASFDDFSASLASRDIGAPKKKSIKETVPFSNITYDFSAINGELYWEERELEYTFEITARTAEELEELKRAFLNWVMFVHKEELHDPFIPDYHFVATYDDMKIEDEAGLEKTTITVTFTADPYMRGNARKVYEYELDDSKGYSRSVMLLNEGKRKVVPVIKVAGDNIIRIFNTHSFDTVEQVLLAELSAGEWRAENIVLHSGVTIPFIECTRAIPCSVTFSFTEEVL